MVSDGTRTVPRGAEDVREELEEGGGVCGDENEHSGPLARTKVLRQCRQGELEQYGDIPR